MKHLTSDIKSNRWMVPDPMGQYHSPYNGMGNNPVNRVDPTGGVDQMYIFRMMAINKALQDFKAMWGQRYGSMISSTLEEMKFELITGGSITAIFDCFMYGISGGTYTGNVTSTGQANTGGNSFGGGSDGSGTASEGTATSSGSTGETDGVVSMIKNAAEKAAAEVIIHDFNNKVEKAALKWIWNNILKDGAWEGGTDGLAHETDWSWGSKDMNTAMATIGVITGVYGVISAAIEGGLATGIISSVGTINSLDDATGFSAQFEGEGFYGTIKVVKTVGGLLSTVYTLRFLTDDTVMNSVSVLTGGYSITIDYSYYFKKQK